MSKTSTKSKDKYNEYAYARFTFRVRKDSSLYGYIDDFMSKKGTSLNHVITGLLTKFFWREEERELRIEKVLNDITPNFGWTDERNRENNEHVKAVFNSNFLSLLEGLNISEGEVKSIKWLCNGEQETIKNIASVMRKISERK